VPHSTGTLYFLFVNCHPKWSYVLIALQRPLDTVLNIATLAAYLTAARYFVLTLCHPLSTDSIIVARFILNMREVGSTHTGAGYSDAGASFDASRFSSVHLAARMVGNMGGELEGSFGIGSRPNTLEGEEDDEAGGVEVGDEGARDVLPQTQHLEMVELPRV